MTPQLNWNLIKPSAAIDNEPLDERKLLKEMYQEATEFVLSFDWCKRIVNTYLGNGIGGVVAAFLFEIAPAKKGVDSWLWVIVGDLPPAYLVLDDARTPAEALQRYIEEMQRWVNHVSGQDGDSEVIPTGVAPTPENASLLASRLEFLRANVVPRWQRQEAQLG